MPPALSISVPVNAAAEADAEPDLNRGAAPGGACAGVPAGRTAALFRQLSALFAEQRAAGVDARAGQDPESFQVLDAGVRALLAAYCADPDADWDRCVAAAWQRARYAQGAPARHWARVRRCDDQIRASDMHSGARSTIFVTWSTSRTACLSSWRVGRAAHAAGS